MAAINEASAVKAQYASPDKLDARISLHAKYSVNRQGFGNWIAEHYRFPAGASVLEVGCGTGEMWKNREGLISACSRLIMTDFSEGMLEKTRENLKRYPGVAFAAVDIQEIPFPDGAFDAVIANMMLYHVPDLNKGLTQVRRVLKDGGTFYCATYGEHGMMDYLCGLFGEYGITNEDSRTFTLQNGEACLRRYFSRVERFDYEDALAVSDLGDMADYIQSLTGLSALRSLPRETILSVLRAHTERGILKVPKEYGLFVSV